MFCRQNCWQMVIHTDTHTHKLQMDSRESVIQLLLTELCRGEECCPNQNRVLVLLFRVGEMMEAIVNWPVCNYCY